VNEPWFHAVWTIGAYLLGSVPTGVLIARAKGVDIRAVGTGNPGAANVYRQVGPAYGIGVYVLDVARGVAATLPLFLLGLPAWSRMLAMVAVVAGHMFPAPWRSIGGTGMAVMMGAALGLLPLGVLVAAAPALAFVRFTRNAGYAGGLYFLLTIAAGWVLHHDTVAVAAVVLGVAAVSGKSFVQYRGR